MDLFNKKALAQLNQELNALYEYNHELKQTEAIITHQNNELKSTIKSIDQKLWAISQSTDQDVIKREIADLCTDMQKRMKAESDRINNIIMGELHNV